jgi:hypothetical protein
MDTRPALSLGNCFQEEVGDGSSSTEEREVLQQMMQHDQLA